jgi:hypothetical protein
MSDGDGRDALASFVKNTNKAHNSEMRAMLEEKKRKLRTYVREAKSTQTQLDQIALQEMRLRKAKGG